MFGLPPRISYQKAFTPVLIAEVYQRKLYKIVLSSPVLT